MLGYNIPACRRAEILGAAAAQCSDVLPRNTRLRYGTRARGGGVDMYESYCAPMASSGALRPAPGLQMATRSFWAADYPCATTNATRFRPPRWLLTMRHC